MLEKLGHGLGSAAWGHWLTTDRPDGASKAATTQESPPDNRAEQAGNLSGLICAARLLADGLELGAKGDELKLSEVLRAAEVTANELFGESHTAAEAVGAGAVSSG